MPISFRSRLTSAGVNTVFLDKTIDDLKKGKLGLYKVDTSESSAITDVQQYIAEIVDTVGIAGEGDSASKDYSSENYISNGDNRKVAIGKLDEALKILDDKVGDGPIKLKSYISDSAYETANGSPTGGEVYYNTTTGKARYYDAIAASWKVIGDQVVGIQEEIGTGNGLNTDFIITNAPLNDEALNVFVNGVLAYKDEYTITLPTISFVSPPAIGSTIYVSYLSNGSPASPIISAGVNNVTYLTATATDISNKFITLPSAPSEPTKILVDVIDGLSLQYGADFSVSGDQLGWDGLSLDGVIESGDTIRVQFFN